MKHSVDINIKHSDEFHSKKQKVDLDCSNNFSYDIKHFVMQLIR